MDPAVQYRIRARATVEDRGHTTPCWVSDRTAQPNGYTKMNAWGKVRLTHRVAYEAYIGPIPTGMQIDHLCGVRACCNPAHLEPVDCRTNLLRGDTITARQVLATHCPVGHPYDAPNTYLDPRGKRGCRACRARQARESRQRRAT